MKKYLLPFLLIASMAAPRAMAMPPVHHAPNREFHMSNIVIRLRFDMNTRTAYGKVSETITPFRTALDSIHLNAVGMHISDVSMNGNELNYRYDGKILTIFFQKPYGLNEHLTYTITYSTQPTRGLFFITKNKSYPHRNPEVWSMSEPEDARYWIPCHDYCDDFTASETITTVPADWTVISNGVLKKVTTIDGGAEKTFDWVESRPHVIYLISVIAGVFQEFKDHLGNLPIDFYSDPNYGSLIASNFSREPDIVKFYSHITGQPFPWEKLALTTVTNFTWGGEENVSAITLTDGTLHDKDAEPEISSVPLIAHETAHQWFGDLMTMRNWANSWMNEGFATYFEALYREHAYGKDAFEYEMYRNHNETVAADNVKRVPTVDDHFNRPVDVFTTYIYPRGASMLNMLRFFLGNTLFDRAIRHYVSEYKHKNVDTHDLAQAITEATGYNMNWFFREWLYKAGHPDFDVSYSYNPSSQMVVMHVEQTQTVDSLTPVYKTPVNIQIVTPLSTVIKRVWIDSLSNTFNFPAVSKPLMVNFDQGHWLLDQVYFPKSAAELEYQLRNDSDVVGRIWAAGQLEANHKDSAEVPLITALRHDGFWAVRRKCATLLGNFKNDAAKAALLKAVNDADSRVRVAAINSLGQFKHDNSLARFLRGFFYDRTNYFERAAAIKAITKVDPSMAVHVIYTALDRNSYHQILRTTALRSLAKIKPDMAHEIAVNYSEYGEPEYLRTAGISVMTKLDMDHNETIRLLSKYVSDPYIWVRAGAIRGLGKLGGKSVIPLLRQRVKNEPDGRLVAMAKKAIKSIEARGQ